MSALFPGLDLDAIAAAMASTSAGEQHWSVDLAGRLGLSGHQLRDGLAQLSGLQPIDAAELFNARADFTEISYVESIGFNIAVAVPAEGEPFLVVADPFDEAVAWRTAGMQAGRRPARLAGLDDLRAFLARAEREIVATGYAGAGDESAASQGDDGELLSLERIEGDNNPVIRLVSALLYDALKQGASDIHFKSTPSGMSVKFRSDGVLVPVSEVQGVETAQRVISRVKVMAELDIAERRVPQDGRFRVSADGHKVDFRVSIMPSIHGEDAVLRLLDRSALTGSRDRMLTLRDLAMADAELSVLRRLIAQPYGMVLVTGPTGSGKTTTLYAVIDEINRGDENIITIEDPVEYQLAGVLQIPVNEKKGLTFARGLRSILRHDPDKIMVGEIRDEETAQIAVQAALTGHLVLTTVHANNAFDVVGRLLHMGVDPYSLASALVGVWAQRLMRVNCPECAVAHVPDAHELADSGLSLTPGEQARLRRGTGCGYCKGTGYKGRRAIAEYLVMTDRIRELISERAPVAALKREARLGTTLRSAALQLFLDGQTTLAEVNRVTFSE